ncbi:MAG: alpha-1,2-fucosyltransferase [Lachnospiraceae bacterium]|nr:alpha-1,2-fucosyltransferase [Lachnospiraceae bacterium]
MVYARIAGGLANQIYQYMGAYSLARKLDQKLILDISMCTDGFTRGFLLNCFPGIRYDGLIKNTLKVKAGVIDNIDSISEEFVKDKCVLLSEADFEQKKNKERSFRVEKYPGPGLWSDKEKEDYYLCGNWLDDAYWMMYLDELREIFFAPEGLYHFLDNFRKKDLSRSVGIHIRRGDFVYAGLTENDDDDYYRAAVEYLQKINSDYEFYVFSDDMDHAVRVLGTENARIHFVHSMDGLYGDVIDFCCLSLCRIKVISAKSTFSKLAFDLNPEHNKKYLVKNREDTGLKHFVRNKAAWLFNMTGCININRKEILYYSSGYPKINADTSISGRNPEDAFKKFKDLYKKKEYEKAEQIAHKIWINEDSSEEFHALYGEILYNMGRLNEAAVEYFRAGNENIIPDDIVYKVNVYKKLDRSTFFIMPDRIIHGVSSIRGMVLIGVLLRRLGHRVCFLLSHDEYYDKYLNKGNTFTDQDGTEYGCVVISLKRKDNDELKNEMMKMSFCGEKEIVIGAKNPELDGVFYFKMSEQDFPINTNIEEIKNYSLRNVFMTDDIYFDSLKNIISFVSSS